MLANARAKKEPPRSSNSEAAQVKSFFVYYTTFLFKINKKRDRIMRFLNIREDTDRNGHMTKAAATALIDKLTTDQKLQLYAFLNEITQNRQTGVNAD